MIFLWGSFNHFPDPYSLNIWIASAAIVILLDKLYNCTKCFVDNVYNSIAFACARNDCSVANIYIASWFFHTGRDGWKKV